MVKGAAPFSAIETSVVDNKRFLLETMPKDILKPLISSLLFMI